MKFRGPKAHPNRGEKPPRGVGSEPGDRQDWQRISGKMRRKSMPVLSVPGALVGGDEVTMAVFHELSRAEGPSQQTGLTANFRQSQPEIHASLVSPLARIGLVVALPAEYDWGDGPGGSTNEFPSKQPVPRPGGAAIGESANFRFPRTLHCCRRFHRRGQEGGRGFLSRRHRDRRAPAVGPSGSRRALLSKAAGGRRSGGW